MAAPVGEGAKLTIFEVTEERASAEPLSDEPDNRPSRCVEREAAVTGAIATGPRVAAYGHDRPHQLGRRWSPAVGTTASAGARYCSTPFAVARTAWLLATKRSSRRISLGAAV